MQQGIHPDYHPVEVTCSCGNTFVTRTAGKEDHMFVDVCSQCHPFYTGKQKILDTGGRVARFEKRYGKKSKQHTSRQSDSIWHAPAYPIEDWRFLYSLTSFVAALTCAIE